MDLSSLKPAAGSTKKRKRIGRGEGSGRGGTSTRGHKGAKSRSGYSKKFGFEGGQMPLYRRLPKFGFKNINRVEFDTVNIDTLNELSEQKSLTDFTIETLVEHGLVSGKNKVKILGRGELNKALNITANAFSKTAKSEIEKQGGKASVI